MSSSETDLFWDSVDKFLAETCHEIPPEDYLWSSDSLASLPFLSTDPFAVEEYDQRLENTLSSWDHDNWGTASTLGQHCTRSPLARPITYLTMPIIELFALKGRRMSYSPESLTPHEVVEPAKKSDGEEHQKSITDDKGVVEEEASTDDEDGTDSEDSIDDNDVVDDEDFIDDEDVICDEDILQDGGVIEVKDVGTVEDERVAEDKAALSGENGTDVPNVKEACSSTETISPQTSTYSCRGCSQADNQWMIACDNNEAHSENEAWYHYGCVQINQDSVPEGQWLVHL